tara:strand:- start:339 stop:1400 length:1062 start_codon:yes stop_codon:yes gene_type:complete
MRVETGMDKFQEKNYARIKIFLLKKNFKGFTKKDLFIMQFIKKGWGQDIAALSNMAEALTNIAISEQKPLDEIKELMIQLVNKALHKSVSPYKQDISNVKSLGQYGYYLEHLNIILGCYQRVINDDYIELNRRVSEHLLANSMKYSNYHAPLLPNSKMKWAADQAAIIYSLWLFDMNNKTSLHNELAKKWLEYMKLKGTHKSTGLFITEVQNVKKFSNQPRGCALSYLIHYMSKFAPEVAKDQWNLYKKHMLTKRLGIKCFREYLPTYKGKWSPDSGPIIAGAGIAATGLGMKAATSVKDEETFLLIYKGAKVIIILINLTKWIPGIHIISRIANDLLASAIFLNTNTKTNWY